MFFFFSFWNLLNSEFYLLSTLQEVNEMWAGLGYYRRARFLLEVRFLFLLWVI